MFITSSRRFLGTLATSTLVFLALPTLALACGAVDMKITKTGPATVTAGQLVEYTVTVTQVGGGGAATLATITDVFPAALIPVSQLEINPPWGPTAAFLCVVSGNTLVCNTQHLGIGALIWHGPRTMKLTFQVSPTANCNTTITNTARFIAEEGDLNLADNTSSSTSTVVCAPTPSPTPTPTPSVSSTPTPTPSVSPSPTPTPTPSPSVSPTPTPSVTPTPTPTPTPSVTKGITVTKTDNRLNTRAGHSVTYVLTVKNTGNTDLSDVQVTDTLPSELTATAISNGGKVSGNTITWTNLQLNKGESKNLTITAKVKNISNCPVLTNKVTVKSVDHNLSASAQDTTKVICEQQVAGAITVVPVPVTAKTGAGMIGLFSTLLGAAGLAVLRKVT